MAEVVDIGATGNISFMAGQGVCDVAVTTLPTAGTPGFAAGCLLRKVNGSGPSNVFYVNVGTKASCNFAAVAEIAATDTLSEATPGAGVTVDNVLLKDGAVTSDAVHTVDLEADTIAQGVGAVGIEVLDNTTFDQMIVVLGSGRVVGDFSSAGVAFFGQGTPTAETGTTQTYTAAEVLTGIITSTQSSAVTATLDTGTNMDNTITTLEDANTGFYWSLINLGSASGAVTLGGASGNTLVGSGAVAIATSARFFSRRTAAATWITYRVS